MLPGGWSPLPLYADPAKNQGVQDTFQTFCLEESEHIYAGKPHAVVFNTKAIKGGVGPQGDPISLGTAWLYHEFQNGDPKALLGYNYQWSAQKLRSAASTHLVPSKTGLRNRILAFLRAIDNYTGAGRRTSARDLQNAIWYLEDEGGSLTAAYTNLLNTKFGSIANAKSDNNGKYPVAALNLYALDANGDPDLTKLRQDMLVCVPVPAAALLGLLRLGTAGLTLRRYV